MCDGDAVSGNVEGGIQEMEKYETAVGDTPFSLQMSVFPLVFPCSLLCL
jgi:hypothetical protein